MNILITGAGMIGCQVAERLIQRGERAVLFDLAPQTENIHGIADRSKVKVIRGNVLEPFELFKVIREENVSRIIHTVTLFGMTATMREKTYATIQVNTMALLNVLEASRLTEIERVVFTSSMAIYLRPLSLMRGNSLNEDFPSMSLSERSLNCYATSKYACELFGLNYYDIYGLDFVAVRFPGVFGPWKGSISGMTGENIRKIIGDTLQGKPVILDENQLGRGALMSLLYSKDAAHAAVLACFAENPQNRVYNIHMGQNYSYPEFAEFLKLINPKAVIQVKKADESLTPPYGGYDMSISKAKEELGYNTEYPMGVALKDYSEWLKANPD